MMKRTLSTLLFALLFMFTPLMTVFAAEEEGANGLMMDGPFIILAFATIILMTYYAFRD